jgi:hypothetical protein
MPENTRAALPGDLVARLRDASVTAAARGRDELDAEVYHACMDAADALAARDAEIARLRIALERADVAMNILHRAMIGPGKVPPRFKRPINEARAALAPPPASDGGEA